MRLVRTVDRLFLRQVVEGQALPRWWGIAWPDPDRHAIYIMPAPLNLVVAFLRWFVYGVRFAWPWRLVGIRFGELKVATLEQRLEALRERVRRVEDRRVYEQAIRNELLTLKEEVAGLTKEPGETRMNAEGPPTR